MTTNLRVILQDVVRWGWVPAGLLVYFCWEFHGMLKWWYSLKDPTATQGVVLSIVAGILPSLATLFTFAVGRITPPTPE